MAAIKNYTDLEQSKKLSKILPLESADMYYNLGESNIPNFIHGSHSDFKCYIMCWSLSALLYTLRIYTTPTAFSNKVSVPSLVKSEKGYKLIYTGDYTPMMTNKSDIESPIESMEKNAIDACYELILKLHELNLL